MDWYPSYLLTVFSHLKLNCISFALGSKAQGAQEFVCVLQGKGATVFTKMVRFKNDCKKKS